MSTQLTQHEVRVAWSAMSCGNCGAPSTEVIYDQWCQQVLCGECRKKKRAAIASLSRTCRLERALGLTGKVVPGTHFHSER